MGLVESKPESGTPESVGVQSATAQRRLKKPQPIIIGGSQITTSVAGHEDDDFGAVDPATKNPVELNAHEREIAHSLLGNKNPPRKLTEGLTTHRRIRRRKREEQTAKFKPPIHAPSEDPHEIE